MSATDTTKLALWTRICADLQVLERGVPLFVTDSQNRAVLRQDSKGRTYLQRTPEMQDLVVRTVERVLGDQTGGLEGLLYMMFKRDGDRVVPLYIGKAGRRGRNGAPVSANLKNIRASRHKFARWGDGYAYHVGDLSAAVCGGHAPSKRAPKYRRWAERLFVDTATLEFRAPVEFWCTAWSADSPGPWPEFGASSLAFTEYLLIGVASTVFPDELLNDEGVNRATP